MSKIIKDIQIFNPSSQNVNKWDEYYFKIKDQNILIQNKSLKDFLSFFPSQIQKSNSLYYYDYENNKIKVDENKSTFFRKHFLEDSDEILEEDVSNGYFGKTVTSNGDSSNTGIITFNNENNPNSWYPCYAKRIKLFNHFVLYKACGRLFNGQTIHEKVVTTDPSNSSLKYIKGTAICTNLLLPFSNQTDQINTSAWYSPKEFYRPRPDEIIDGFISSRMIITTINNGTITTNSIKNISLAYGYNDSYLNTTDSTTYLTPPSLNLYALGGNLVAPASDSGSTMYLSFCFYYPCTFYTHPEDD